MASHYPINPMYLLGQSFTFTEVFPVRNGLEGPPEGVAFFGRVVAVQVPHPFSGIPWALLIDQPPFGVAEHYVPIDSLIFEWPTSHGFSKTRKRARR